MGAPFEQMLRPVAPILDDAPKLSPPSLDRGIFLRTRSRRSRSPFAIGPRPDVIEIERAVIKAILGAERLIYLETQFLRLPVIVQTLVRAASRNTASQLIIVVPAAPDDVAFDDNRGADARQGEWLQVRAVRLIQKAWGDRCGVFSLAQPRPISADENALPDRATLQGALIVYVHAKVSIFDSRDAIVGSANLNARSMRWDTETAVHWRDRESVQALQNELLASHFDHAVDAEGPDPLRFWSTRAQENAGCSPEQQQGYIMPYDLGAAAKTAKYRCWVPTNMV
jgi:phosphatidylserine/phosphatidylglycerophosphate/cardiolipin synthase-like enzyme